MDQVVLSKLRSQLELAASQPEDDELFRECVELALTVLQLEEIELANELSVSRSTVQRWRGSGELPHPVMRKPVYDVLVRRVVSCGFVGRQEV